MIGCLTLKGKITMYEWAYLDDRLAKVQPREKNATMCKIASRIAATMSSSGIMISLLEFKEKDQISKIIFRSQSLENFSDTTDSI